MDTISYIAAALADLGARDFYKDTREKYYSLRELRREAANYLRTSDYSLGSLSFDAALKRLSDAGIYSEISTPHAAPRYKFNLDDYTAYKNERIDQVTDTELHDTLDLSEKLGLGWLQESFETALNDKLQPETITDDLEITDQYDAVVVPASDRYVLRTDNTNALAEAGAQLDRLKEAIEGNNEASEEEREIALSEIAAFEASIVQPRIPYELIERFAKRILSWIALKFSGVVVTEVVTVLCHHLLKMIGLS